MTGADWLARRFEEHRGQLRAVAYRMLGTPGDADDAVQEAWLRLSRAGASDVENLGAWLTTVVARVCLDVLRARRARREEDGDDVLVRQAAERRSGAATPEDEAHLADALGPALLVVLDALEPAERVAFVLHDVFGVPFDEIAAVVGRTPAAARQLASRARRRVRGAEAPADPELARRRELVAAFFAASRDGDLDRLLAVLDPDAVVRADGAAVAAGAEREIRGARAVAESFRGRAQAAVGALVDGAPGAVWSHGGRPRAVFAFTLRGGKVAAIDLVMDPAAIGELELEIER